MDENPVEYVDDPTIREVLIEHIRLTTFDGLVKIEGAIGRPKLSGVNQSTTIPHTAARLVLTLPAALQLSEQLGQMVKKLEQDGLLKRMQPGPAAKQ